MKMAVFQWFRCFVGSPAFGASSWPLGLFLASWPLAGLSGLLLASASCWPLASLLLGFVGLVLKELEAAWTLHDPF